MAPKLEHVEAARELARAIVTPERVALDQRVQRAVSDDGLPRLELLDGLRLQSPDGTVWTLRITDGGVLYGAGVTVGGETVIADWATITGKPSTFPPSAHDHDDRYYTETEVNTALAAKAALAGATFTGSVAFSAGATVKGILVNGGILSPDTVTPADLIVNSPTITDAFGAPEWQGDTGLDVDSINGLGTALAGKSNTGHTHAASDINAGTLNVARIPPLPASQIGSGTLEPARLPVQVSRLASDASTSGTAGITITGTSITVSAGQVWEIDLVCRLTGATDGIRWRVNAPSGSTAQVVIATRRLDTDTLKMADSSDVITAPNTLSTAVSGGIGFHPGHVHGYVTAGGSGTVSLSIAAATSGQTVTVQAGAYIRATRVA